MSIQVWLPDYQKRINDSLIRYFAKISVHYTSNIEVEFFEALKYAVEGWWKRLRPILSILAYEHITQKSCPDSIIDAFIGIEFMHCYTLVHDDLPCIDNDILRRGKPTVWKQYSNTIAVLVWDSLQTMAFDTLSQLDSVEILRELAQSLGHTGVVLGQIKDTIETQENYNISDIMRVHDLKTGWFIASCLVIGVLAAGLGIEKSDKLRKFGLLLGRAFQVRDDILDVEGESSKLWKTIGKDLDQQKWLVQLVWIDQTKIILQEIEQDLQWYIQKFENPKLRDVVEYVVKRDN